MRERRLLYLVAVAICAMKCSVHLTSLNTSRGDLIVRARTRMMRVQNMRTLVVMMMSMTLRGVIAAVAIPAIAAIVVPVLMSALRKRRRIETRYDLLLKTNHGCLIYAI